MTAVLPHHSVPDPGSAAATGVGHLHRQGVAALLGLHLGGVYELLQDGTIPAKQFRRRWIISRNQFHAWLDGTPESGA